MAHDFDTSFFQNYFLLRVKPLPSQSPNYLINPQLIIYQNKMKEGVGSHQAFFNHYANSHNYEVKEIYSSQSYMVTGSNEAQREMRQAPYNIKNLPIIYDSEPRSSTPTKQPGSSRVVYGDRDKSDKHLSSSPVVKYEMMPFAQPKPQTFPKPSLPIEQQRPPSSKFQYSMPSFTTTQIKPDPSQLTSEEMNNRSRTIIAGLVDSKPLDYKVSSSYDPNYRGQKNVVDDQVVQINREIVEKDQKGGSRLVVENINAYLQPAFSTKSVRSYVSSEVVHGPVSEIPMKTQNLPTGNLPPSNPSLPPMGNLPHPNPQSQPQSFSNKSVNNLTFMAPQHSTSQKQFHIINAANQAPRPIPHGISHLSTETVPRVQYEKCVNECKNWETKYNELYLKYMNLATSIPESNTGELDALRQQNFRLKNQLREQENKSIQSLPILESKFSEMVNSQKEATVRECMLLIQRFRLQSRQQGKF